MYILIWGKCTSPRPLGWKENMKVSFFPPGDGNVRNEFTDPTFSNIYMKGLRIYRHIDGVKVAQPSVRPQEYPGLFLRPDAGENPNRMRVGIESSEASAGTVSGGNALTKMGRTLTVLTDPKRKVHFKHDEIND